jgi:hypothetical protein
LCLAPFEPYRKSVVALVEGVSTGPALRARILKAPDPAVVLASIQGSPLDLERLVAAMHLQEKPAGLNIQVDQGSSPLPTASTGFNKLHIDTTVLTVAACYNFFIVLIKTLMQSL